MPVSCAGASVWGGVRLRLLRVADGVLRCGRPDADCPGGDFRPRAPVIPFDTAEEAIALGNQTEYGLGGAVWTRDISTALRVVQDIHTGVMWVNCYGLIDPMVGFGGTKLSGTVRRAVARIRTVPVFQVRIYRHLRRGRPRVPGKSLVFDF